MTVVVAPIFGPLLGGYITDNLSWPWIFYINAPVGVFAAMTTWTLLHKHDTPTVKVPFDAVGLVLLVVGVGSLQLMLDNGNDLDWFNSNVITTLSVLAIVALTFLVIWELDDAHPLVDLTLFKYRNFRFGVLSLALGFMSFFGMTVLLPLWLQTVMGYTSTWAGVATAPVGILALVCSPLLGRFMHRLDLRVFSTLAFVVFAWTTWWFSRMTLDVSIGELMLPRLVQGVATACFFVPINQIILSGIEPRRLAAASGLSNFFRSLSGSIGTSIVITLWDHRTQMHEVRLWENITPNSVEADHYLSQLGQVAGIQGDGAWRYIGNLVHQQSAMFATSELFWGIAVLFLCLIAVIWQTRPPFGAPSGAGGH